MSGQNTPISTTLSLLSLNAPRVSVEATINSDQPGITGRILYGSKAVCKNTKKGQQNYNSNNTGPSKAISHFS
jgi:hypothetical protein